MVDLRYLALTMIGIFLALAIGLMVGSALGTPERQSAVYENLRQQFDLLREQNQSVRDANDAARRRLEAREQAEQALLPLAVRGRLPGSSVGVVICGTWDQRGFWSELESAFRAAGAEIGPVARIPDHLREVPADIRMRMGSLRDPAPLTEEAQRYAAAGWVVRALARGGAVESLEAVARAAGIRLSGDYQTPVRRLLVLTSVPDDLRAANVAAGDVPELRVVDVALEEGMRVVAAEPEETSVSALEGLRRRNIPTVDNIDTASGQISAILALAGADGHFGSKPGASRPMAPLDRP